MEKNIKIKYALNINNELIKISQVDKIKKEKYYCISCNNELIARKGDIRAHHFSHKVEVDCNFETYLHKLCKLLFSIKYKECLKNNKSFILTYETQPICTACKQIAPLYKECSEELESKTFDLCNSFDQVNIEKEYSGFIADILLQSTKHKEVIFIEFAVTHLCEKEKIDSKQRIIEFEISSEEDLEWLNREKIIIDLEIGSRYNFKDAYFKNKSSVNVCNKKHNVFILYLNGKGILKSVNTHELINEYKNKEYSQFELIDDDEKIPLGRLFIDMIRKYYMSGNKVNNCYICSSSEKNRRINSEHNIFCKLLKREISNSNSAIECNNFWPIEKEKLSEIMQAHIPHMKD